MKGKYSMRWLISVCCIILGVTAIALTVSLYLGYGELPFFSLLISVCFAVICILWVVHETGWIFIHNYNEEAEQEEGREEADDDWQENNLTYQSERQGEVCDGSIYNEEEIQNTDDEIIPTDIPGTISFSLEELKEIYDYDSDMSPEERQEKLKLFREYRQNLQLTEKAKSEVGDVKKETALLHDTDDADALFYLYNEKYLVPALRSYLTWYGKSFKEIQRALDARMIKDMFTYLNHNEDRNVCIVRLEPAIVTEGADGEYFIEEEKKGRLYFRSLN